MKILVIGGGNKGASVISQLKKNDKIEIIVADWKTDCVAVKKGHVEKIHVHAHVTPLNMKDIIDQVTPDLVILARSEKDWRHEDTVLGGQFVAGMERELLHSCVPVIIADRAMTVFE